MDIIKCLYLAGEIWGLGLVLEVLRKIRLSIAIWVELRRVIGAASRAFSLSVAMVRLVPVAALISNLSYQLQQEAIQPCEPRQQMPRRT
ncbi:TPA: hypothetical protein PXS11_001027 [Yersinia enterocolitica]|nr:hypothetical protein [Yersinia enterocolitica]